MTEQKPAAWIYDTAYPGMGSTPALSFGEPEQGHPFVKGPARPLYEHPAPAQPATDSAVEAARRKALHEIFGILGWHPYRDDHTHVQIHIGVLRDLVGHPRKAPERRIPGYDEEPGLKASATMRKTRVNTADFAQKEAIDFIAEGLEAAHAARTHTDAMWWLMTDSGKEKWRAEARVLVARAAKAL